MYGLADAVVHPYVPFRKPEELHRIVALGGDRGRGPTNYEQFLRLREGSRLRSDLASSSWHSATVQAGQLTREYTVSYVSANLFAVLGVAPAMGRTFPSSDGLAANEQLALLSDRAWRQIRGSRNSPDELVVSVDGASYTVVGVMPPGMNYPFGADVWLPIPARALATGEGLGRPAMLLRMRPDAAGEASRRELAAAAARITADYGLADRPVSYRLEPVRASFSRLNPVHLALGGAVGVVLLIACANLTTLLLVRTLSRRRELAVRAALGATRGALLRLVLSESVLSAVGGGVLGVVLAVWGIGVAHVAIPPSVEQLGFVEPHLSWSVFAFALAVAACAVLLATLMPALRAAAADPADVFKDGAGATTGRSRHRYSPLVIAEVALALMLLMGAGLLLKSSRRLHAFAFGYDPRGLIAAVTPLPPQVVRTPGGVARFYNDLLDRARVLPGVEQAALLGGASPRRLQVTAEDPGAGTRERFLISYQIASPRLLRTLGVRVLAGRDFEEGDAVLGGVAIVDSSLAERLWPNSSPVGRLLKLGHAHSDAPWVRVVGVSGSAFLYPAPDEFPPEALYVVRRVDDETRRPRLKLVVRGQKNEAGLALALRREVDAMSVGANAPALVYPWTRDLDGMVEQTDFLTALLVAFAGFGVLVAVVGLYGALAYGVRLRLREFAVRVLLGADGRDIAGLVIHDSAVTVLAGTGVGAFVALWAARALRFSLFGFDTFDPWALIGAEAILFAAAALACHVPVRLATRADPLQVLRAS